MKDSNHANTAKVEETGNVEVNPADVAASFFQGNIEVFNRGVRLLSSSQAKRLLKGLMAYPLQRKPASLLTTQEKALFNLGTDLMQAKTMMILESMSTRQETTKTNTTPKGEENVEERE